MIIFHFPLYRIVNNVSWVPGTKSLANTDSLVDLVKAFFSHWQYQFHMHCRYVSLLLTRTCIIGRKEPPPTFDFCKTVHTVLLHPRDDDSFLGFSLLQANKIIVTIGISSVFSYINILV